MSKIAWTVLAPIASIAFLLNVVWENAQAPLYQGYTNFWQHLSTCSIGALGDVVIILLIYVLIAAIRKNLAWAQSISREDIALSVLFGIAAAVGIEWHALATGSWDYRNVMPIIPLVNVGLLPVVQMALLPAITFKIISYCMNRGNNTLI